MSAPIPDGHPVISAETASMPPTSDETVGAAPLVISSGAAGGVEKSFSREISDYPEGIVLPINKPYRWTSADVIRKVKYAAIKHFRKKNLKVGHAGTLDPLATGVLLVCIGPACKRAQELQDHDKEYVAGISFGATTPSYDLEKEVDRLFPYDHVTEEAVRAILPSFLGTQEQIAPLFSAKSVDGVRAYEMARKMYRNAQKGLSDPDFDAAALATLHTSTITIHDIELLSFSPAPPDFSTRPSALVEMTGNGGAPDVLSNGYAEAVPIVISSGAGGGVEKSVAGTASSRIHVADTSSLGLPHASIRIACSTGTYLRAFARDLGEALGTGAHLDSLIRTRTGDYRLSDALTLDQALSLLAEA